MAYVIEYFGTPPCWIADRKGTSAAFDVTFQRPLAHRFASRDEAMCEILRLGLPMSWTAANVGEDLKKEES